MPMAEYRPPGWKALSLMVMTDDSIAETVAQRHAFAAMAITPALSMDMMKNAPPEGAYLLVRYADKFDPLHVDRFGKH